MEPEPGERFLEASADILEASADENLAFDLAEYTEEQIRRLVHESFSTQLAANVTVSFQVKAIKVGEKGHKERYSNQAKWLTTALHDKREHVFSWTTCHGRIVKVSNVLPAEYGAASPTGDRQSIESREDDTFEKDERCLMVTADIETFKEFVKERTPTWAQRRKLLSWLNKIRRQQTADAAGTLWPAFSCCHTTLLNFNFAVR